MRKVGEHGDLKCFIPWVLKITKSNELRLTHTIFYYLLNLNIM